MLGLPHREVAGLCIAQLIYFLGHPARTGLMPRKTSLVRFGIPEQSTHPWSQQIAEIQGEHLVLLISQGRLAALFLLEIIESWTKVRSKVQDSVYEH